EIREAWFRAIVALTQDRVVHGAEKRDLLAHGARPVSAGYGKPIEEPDEGRVRRTRGAGRREGREGARIPRALGEQFHGRARRDVANAWQEVQDAIPAHIVARILE